MIPYARHEITSGDINAVLSVLCSDRLTQGPTVGKLQATLAEKCGAKYCVAVNSGTAALHLAYLSVGVGLDRSIVTSPVSFVATANAALYCGADVIFNDVNPTTGLVLHNWIQVAYRSFVPVTLGGQPYGACSGVVDACHGPFTHDKHAKATCFSFHPCKHVAAGEGGAIVTNDIGIATDCHQLRDHGDVCGPGKREMIRLGFNYRLAEMPAALALSQLQRLDWNIEQRRRIAALYDSAFEGRVQPVVHSPQSARHLYQILVDKRDVVRQELAKLGVGTQVHYEPIIPLQPYYRERFSYREGMFPNAERYAARTLSLPLFPTMTDKEIDTVISAVSEVI